MGAKCCRGHRGSVVESNGSVILSLADLEVQATDLREMTVVEARDAAGPSEPRPPSPTLRPSEVEETSEPVCQGSLVETSNTDDAGPSEPNPPSPTLRPSEVEKIYVPVCQGSLAETSNLDQDGVSSYEASNIFWSTGSLSDPIPSGFYTVIPVERLMHFKSIPTLEEINALGEDRLKADAIFVDLKNDIQLVLIKEFVIKLVTGLDSDKVIKKIAGLVANIYKRKTLQSPARTLQYFDVQGFTLLGQIKHGSCRARAILFKVLADAVGLDSKLVMGFPTDLRFSASIDSYNHISAVVELNNVEMLVDLKRCPGQLKPFSPKAVYMAHISMAWQPDFVDNNPCASPLEPNSPMERSGPPSALQSGLSRSLGEPNIATEVLRRKVIKEPPPADFSGNSGAAESESKRTNGRCMNTPDLNNDIARATMMQSDLLKERGVDDSSPYSPDEKNVSGFQLDSHDLVSGECSTVYPRKSISLPSSPRSYQIQLSERSEHSPQEISHIWNEVLESPMFQNKPLLPFEEWNIDFSKLKVGASVGSGTSGVVCRGVWNKTEVAIKIFLGQQLTAENMKVFCNEISILRYVSFNFFCAFATYLLTFLPVFSSVQPSSTSQCYSAPWSMHKASSVITGHRVYEYGVLV
ncbi:Mitogen activated protein kinase kinase kinase-like protein [Arabidopsis thaliana]|uniref:Mitogen activated protein kinase kinase kinase-like protein n=1 Tax=Arabidopsis thaliana TaxID=3702 RepID=A0A1P8AZY0_ARATH|nr:Mitogen activated protein kinase kinase kinase-like protein [Arabidopsis thaliana]ANM62200.1 Mitogen activated protein kinase kinase kinase-like protein [Arabidopsis thaliana]|eukprot:NP_001324376.1 Mitogen activated protein kinase kinase kinase-like protein [Arabidopsis thaliana]